ncbi:polysaccharide biosynthesis C-terminal domain-containing protein [Candidatus Contubernalis alkaliaceticus]|uniref:polysaccharide biosynthesis C-terminal domain-containing protein n=1 Tax=Candidatus Contubernalis alkaliaceticus TaxID=338645 RepID=UPI001F4C1DB4|nr:NAD-dependent epimerase/dehydratase family protein [Candidatus Contubernalis alkalaceticus]UNC93621.1 SDR family oxidoreductase [Candidatus Contubernalis alkalaceticus]
MKTVLVTGADGFMGRNLKLGLEQYEDLKIITFSRKNKPEELEGYLQQADLVYHLAGINRPENPEEFETGNAGLTETIVDILGKNNLKPDIVFSSSIQALKDNPYGKSKKQAEDTLLKYREESGAQVYIYRLPNVFGKWSRPNYNSVVATFCYNICRGLPITISDPNNQLELVYIDDVVKAFTGILSEKLIGGEGAPAVKAAEEGFFTVPRTFCLTLGELAQQLYHIRDNREKLTVPDFSHDLTRCLYATYLSFLDKKDFSRALDLKTDQRGSLAEVVKSESFGQIFVSSSHEGVMRGNHYHHTKVEKFCVIKGEAVIKFRKLDEEEVLSYEVSGDKPEVVDIPPGYTHAIENLTRGEMIVLFWANQIFDPENPDTYYCEV